MVLRALSPILILRRSLVCASLFFLLLGCGDAATNKMLTTGLGAGGGAFLGAKYGKSPWWAAGGAVAGGLFGYMAGGGKLP